MTRQVDRGLFEPSAAAIFPLPLTGFEKYMVRDDRPDYPMTCVLRMRLSGQIDRPAFESSFEEALSHHPLLCSLVDDSARGKPAWVLAEKQIPLMDWGPLEAAVECPRGDTIDLRSEIGLRVWVRQGDGTTEVTLQFHHACSDAGGSLRFVGQLLTGYGTRVCSTVQSPTPWTADPSSLPKRGQFVADVSAVKENRIRALWARLLDAERWLVRRPTTIVPDDSQTGSDAAISPFMETFRHVFEESETKNLLQAAARQSVTVNDLLLRDIFITLREWNAERAPGSADHWLRLLVPVKLKTAHDERMPAANGLSYNFLTRRESQCVDRSAFLQGISRENDPATRYRRGMAFLTGLQVFGSIPGALSFMTMKNRCFATAVLSNLGDLGRFFGARFPCQSGKIVAGNLILEDIFGAPPIRPKTHAAFSVGTYGGRMWIGVRRDSRKLTADGARSLLGMYVDRLKNSAVAVPKAS